MNSRTIPVLAVAVGLALTACGTSDPSTTESTAAEPEPVSTEAAPAEPADEQTATVAPVESPAPQPDVTEADAGEAPATEAPATEVPATEAPDTAAPEPEPAPVGGRSLAVAVEPASQFDGNPFPDLVVNDVGRDAGANIRNILPSDRPVLLWTWAPH